MVEEGWRNGEGGMEVAYLAVGAVAVQISSVRTSWPSRELCATDKEVFWRV